MTALPDPELISQSVRDVPGLICQGCAWSVPTPPTPLWLSLIAKHLHNYPIETKDLQAAKTPKTPLLRPKKPNFRSEIGTLAAQLLTTG